MSYQKPLNMPYELLLGEALEEIRNEVRRAKTLFPDDFVNQHEAYAVLLEEVDELWAEIKKNQKDYNLGNQRKEAKQVAAMVCRLMVELLSREVVAQASVATGGEQGNKKLSPKTTHLKKEYMKYRKKPVVIEAIQWEGPDTNTKEIEKFVGKKLEFAYDPEDKFKYKLLIPTLESPHEATAGDFIIKGIHGEFYPCKPDIFENSYELVNE